MARIKFYNKTSNQWEYADSNNIDSSSDIAIDATLSKEGQAADAKTVGDALANKQPKGEYLTEVPAGYAKTADLGDLATKDSLTASDVGADASGTASSLVSEHNSDEAAHADIRELISELSGQNVNLPDNLVYYVSDEVDSGGDEEGGAANGSTVTVEQILTSGVEIAKITVDGEETTIYAPEASTGGGGSGGGGSAGTPDFSLVFSTTTTEELGSIPVNLDLSPYSEILGFIKTLPADGKSSGHITWSMANAAGCFCYINSSIHATQERIHRLHITRYTNNNWFGDMSYAIPSAASIDTFRGCLLSGTRLNTVGSYMGGVALKIGTTVEIYAR